MNLFARIKALFSRPKPVADRPFKVGDRVVAKDPGYNFGVQEGVITKVIASTAFEVCLPGLSGSHRPVPPRHGSAGWTFYAHELKLLS